MSESKIQREILETLFRIPGSVVLRNNNTPIYDPRLERFRKMNTRFQPIGVSDIFLWVKGDFFAIEVKTESEYKYLMKRYDQIKDGFFSHKSRNSTERKKARLQSQILFIEDIKNAGFYGFFCYSVEQVLKEINI